MDIIEKFLQNYSSKNTIKSYRAFLKQYFRVIKHKPDAYFKPNHDYEEDVLKYWRYLNGRPPKTIATSIACIRMFLSENDHELPSKYWRGIRNRTKGTRAVTEDKIPTLQEIKQILSHADLRGRALFLTLLQSGMRIGELTEINISDIDFSFKPTKIRIRAETTKTGNQRYCFIGKEAADSLKSWLDHRETFLNASLSRARALQRYYNRDQNGRVEDDRVFPFSISTVRYIWNNLLENAKLSEKDKRTKVRKMHPHVLRKYYRTHMSLSVPLDVVEALMGHEGYLTEAYRRYTIEQLGEQYLKGEQDVSIFSSTSKDLQELRQSDKEKDEKIKNLENIVDGLKLRVDMMEKIEKINEKIEKIKTTS